MTRVDLSPETPLRYLCEECQREGANPRRGAWIITVTAGYPGKGSRGFLVCDLHAQWYLAQSPDIYPREAVPDR